jgi:hypothetical protein
MSAAEDSFSVGARNFAAGSVIVPLGSQERAVRSAIDSLGLTAVAVGSAPNVRSHELAAPRIGIVHSWLNTQNEGWVRYAFDRYAIPYTYLSTQQLRDSARIAQFDVLVLPYVTDNARAIVNGQPMLGPPVPWHRSAETPALGLYDETDDVRPGIGLIGMTRLESWIKAGGVLITEGGTASVPIQYGLTPGVDIVEPRQLKARGNVVRARLVDRTSPIAYGYADTLAVYFNQTPLLATDTSAERGTEQERDSSLVAATRRARPRVVVRFHPRADSLLISGLLDAGTELASRPAVVDVQVGNGHVVLFAIRPFWRWETQGSFALAFNAVMNWNHLSVGWPAAPAAGRGRRAGR